MSKEKLEQEFRRKWDNGEFSKEYMSANNEGFEYSEGVSPDLVLEFIASKLEEVEKETYKNILRGVIDLHINFTGDYTEEEEQGYSDALSDIEAELLKRVHRLEHPEEFKSKLTNIE